MTRITVILHDDEREALQVLSKIERRHIREQAAVLIRCELERRGMLVETDVSTNPQNNEVQDAKNPG